MPMTSTKNASEASWSGVRSSTGPRWARSDTLVEPVEVVGERAGLQLRALVGLLRFALLRRDQDLVRAGGIDDGGAVGVEDHQVAGVDRLAADGDRHVQLARDVLGRAARPDPARPH